MTRASLAAAALLGLWTFSAAAALAQVPLCAKAGDSSAALAFTKKPLRAWWETLTQDEKRRVLDKHELLAVSFDLHRRVLGASAHAGLVEDRSLQDWWDGLSRETRERLLREQPKLREALESWRRKIDEWTARERRANKGVRH